MWCVSFSGYRHSLCGVQLLGSNRLQDDGQAFPGPGAGRIVGLPRRIQSDRHRGKINTVQHTRDDPDDEKRTYFIL